MHFCIYASFSLTFSSTSLASARVQLCTGLRRLKCITLTWNRIRIRIKVMRILIFSWVLDPCPDPFYQFFSVVLLQIHFGSGTVRIRNDFFRRRIRSCLKFWIRPDLDPQRCLNFPYYVIMPRKLL
jgi:hypothetical protein